MTFSVVTFWGMFAISDKKNNQNNVGIFRVNFITKVD